MSIIKEYISLIGRGIANLDKIAEGIVNKANFKKLSQEKQKTIIDRAAICATCPFNSEKARTSQEYFDLFGKHYESDRTDSHCSHCGCVLALKVMSLYSECGLSYWNEANPDKQIPLKWTKYEKAE